MQWETRRKALFVLLLVITAVALFIVMQILLDDDRYQLLYANLVPEDYSAITAFLESSDINFKENLEQRSLYVPSARVDLVRLELARRKLPSSTNNSNDLMGGRPLAFIESLAGGDSRLAVQHELAKTLSTLDPIRYARVHLESPHPESSSANRSGATVLVSLTPGHSLTADQLHTVIHLVSTSVAGLEPGNIRVFDSSGKLLSADSRSGDGALFPDSTLVYQRSVEHRLEQKAQDLVDAMIGSGHALIRISASLDFSRNETTTERYDPDDQVVRSEQVERQPLTGSGSTDLPGQSSGLRSRSSITTTSKVDYEVSKTTSKTIRPEGELRQLSVTILVADEKSIGDDGTVTFQPRSDEELEEIRSLVAGMLPLDPERGDIIHLRRMVPDRVDGLERQGKISLFYEISELIPVGKIMTIFFVFILFYWLLLKPIIGLLRSEIALTDSDSQSLEREKSAEPSPEPEEDLAATLKKEVQNNPLATAHIIRKWIQEA